ncbi:MAG TPA: TRAP transporter fused permease subunit [Clostridia bacterium]|nr:TRAP transporter fused permease subunit [Clostridia bacterium]
MLPEESEAADRAKDGRAESVKPSVLENVVYALSVLMGLFHLYTAYSGTLEAWRQRSIHLIFVLLVFLFGDLARKAKAGGGIRRMLIPYTLLALAVAVSVFMYVDYWNITWREAEPNQLDVIFSTILIALVLITVWKSSGWPITIVVGLFIVYALFGYVLPGRLGHRGVSYTHFTYYMFNSTHGIFGVPLGVAAVDIVMLIIFGAFVEKSGAGEFFIELANSLTGRSVGGPAKAAVVASGFMGMISGSGVANAVTTGVFTIPLMKKTGYRPVFAAAVEAAASTGGMILPPVMASVAFLIAEFTKTPYRLVMLYCALPAVLYFTAVYMMVHLEALKTGLKPLDPGDIPKASKVLLSKGYYLLPIVILTVLLVRGLSPMKSAFWGIVVTVLLAGIRKETRMGPREIAAALARGAQTALPISITCAAAGLIVGSLSASGLGLKFSGLIIALAGGRLFLVLVLTAVSCIILGMGMPAAPAYVIVSALAVPVLTEMKVNVMAAHIFVFYYSIISAITPPVALAAYGAAGIAGADETQVGLTACRLAATAMIVPFIFAYDQALLLMGRPSELIVPIITAFIGVYALSAGLQGWFYRRATILERGLLLVSSVLLMYPERISDWVGLAFVLGVYVYERATSGRGSRVLRGTAG